MRVPVVASVIALICGTLLLVQPAHAVRQTAVTEIVQYECKPTDGAGQSQNISVQIVLTMPTDAKPGEQLEIGWQGTYLGAGLVAPATGLAAGTKLYAYAGISGFQNLTSATGVAELGAINAGEVIPLPSPVTLRTTPQAAGTGTVRPGAINFGPTPNQPSIECEVKNRDELKTYPLTVGAGSSTTPSPSPSPQPTPTTSSPQPTPTTSSPQPTPTTTSPQPTPTPSSPQPTPTPSVPLATVTTTVTAEPDDKRPAGGVITTPVGGVDTGGGGELGPDGRHLIVVGSLLVLAAGTGLLLRRRTLS